MITYVVEVTVPVDLADAWVDYMTSGHIADVVNTGCFLSATLVRVVDPSIEGAAVFRSMYVANTLDDVARYRRDHAPALQAHHTERFGDRVRAVRSVTHDVWSTD